MPHTEETDNTIKFMLPLVVSNLPTATSETINTSAPTTNESTRSKTYKTNVIDSKLKKNTKLQETKNTKRSTRHST